MRLLIAGGGTGGHLYPGVAIAEELLGRGAGHSVLFAGTDRGLEARVLPNLGLRLEVIRSAGLVGTGLRGALRSLGLLTAGLADANRVIRSFRPQACLGVGGYVSFPVVGLARLLGVPTAVQEQNAWPGLANRLLARIVKRVYAGVPEALAHFPRVKTRLTGNPLRKGLALSLPYRAPAPGETARLLVLGGSQGARAINEIVPLAVAELAGPLEVLHQAGRGKREAVEERYTGGRGARVVEFVDDMPSAYQWAHLVIARAGALTVAELASSGRPAVLVPFPLAAGNHQEANARAAEKRGAAVCLLEPDLTGRHLAKALEELLSAPDRLAAMAAAAADSALRTAARDIVDDLLALATGGGDGPQPA